MKKLSFLFALLILLNGCKEEDDTIQDDEQQNSEAAENVVVILDENSNLISSETDLNNGIYKVEFINEVPEIIINDIIVGDEGNGFLRIVSSVSVSGNTLVMQTTQVTMDDIFNDASVEFTTDISDFTNGTGEDIVVNYVRDGVTMAEDGLTYDFSNTTLYDENGLTFQITNGTATFDPNFNFKADYTFFGGLDYLNFGTDNATLSIDCDLSLNASGNVTLPGFNETLLDFDKKLTFIVAGLPVVVVVNTELVAELSAGIDANLLVTSGFTNNYTLTSGIKHENDIWTGNFDLGSTLTPKPIDFSGEVNFSQNLTITPKVSVKFYNVIGPYCEPKMTEDFTLNVASPSLDWDSELKVGLDLTTGINVSIFGYSIDPYSRTDSFEEIIWNAPHKIEKAGGNNQTGNQGQQLDNPIRVKVTDNLGNAISNVPVYFTTTVGNGTVNPQSAPTDANGYAEVNWTLGSIVGEQHVEAKIKKEDGTTIENGSLNFTATAEASVFDFTGTWMISYYHASVTHGVDYLHQQDRFTLNSSGYAPTSETRYPVSGDLNWYPSGEIQLYYENGAIIIDASVGFYVVVNDVNDTVLYSSNWETIYTVDDYYWKIKFEKL